MQSKTHWKDEILSNRMTWLGVNHLSDEVETVAAILALLHLEIVCAQAEPAENAVAYAL